MQQGIGPAYIDCGLRLDLVLRATLVKVPDEEVATLVHTGQEVGVSMMESNILNSTNKAFQQSPAVRPLLK